MEEKINIAELLKDCPKGMELDCVMSDKVTFDYIDVSETDYPIVINTPIAPIRLTINGCYYKDDYAKCVIFPKGQTTWEGFQRPFKDGDVLFVDCSDKIYKVSKYIFILNKPNFYGEWHSHCHLDGVGNFYSKETYLTDKEYNPRFATEEEKQKLFKAIKDNGYKWNTETKTLEKLDEPKFKVGDKIKHKTHISQGYVVTEIKKNTHYILDDESALPFVFQDEYELVPNKFDITTLKPFDKVLIRQGYGTVWIPSFWGGYIPKINQSYPYLTSYGCVNQCIPFEGNQELLGTTKNPKEYGNE